MTASRIFRTGLLPLVLLALTPGPCSADAYRFDAGHTVASFRCGTLGLWPESGRISGARGEMVFDPAHPGDSAVDVSLDMTTLRTHWGVFDGQVRGPDFLDVERFPTATFKSRRVEVTGDGTANVTGDLTLHGVTRLVTMAVVVRKAAANAPGLDFSATTRIRRSDFGIDRPEPFLSDMIELRVEAAAAPSS